MEPSSNFFAWVAQFKPTRLARSLGVTRCTVHKWVTPIGQRHKPRIETVLAIIELSKIEPLRGEVILTVSDILGEVEISRMNVNQQHPD